LQTLNTLINSLTNKTVVLSKELNFYFLVVLFRIVPFKKKNIEILSKCSMTPNQKYILEQSHRNDCISTQLIFKLFRNYLKFIDPQTITLYMKL
jgi:hypothetical protein